MIMQTLSGTDGSTHTADQTADSFISVSFPSARGTFHSESGPWFGISVVIVLVFMAGIAIFIGNGRQATEKR
ncbi:MAG TPA: hypothetical protein PKK43_02815 [Spirochaetota bacterium]|nr:hypothetical protein [Spirochaetota bacterium]